MIKHTKEELEEALDVLRKDTRSFIEGTEQYKARVDIEWLLEEHLYTKDSDGQ